MTNQNIESFPPLVDPQNLQPLLPCDAGLCSKSGANYQVLSGIPRVVPNLTNYADAFGDQWKRWRLTQLDSHTGTSITADRLNRCLGDELVHKLSGQGEIQILEAGCGAGRFTEILLGYPVVRLTSADLSSAVESNQINFPQNQRHRIVQCDICLAPFKPDSFDVVVCLGVIQHTPNPELTIRKLFEQVKPNGWLVFDH
jgi:2-polyprenyl-3-methyl-5-hydroxy-6-metoxy-1,4-benzoquinol methylase